MDVNCGEALNAGEASAGNTVAGVRANSSEQVQNASPNNAEGSDDRTPGSFDVRVQHDRAKSRILNRATSYQKYVPIEDWLKVFPDVSRSDLGPGFIGSSFRNGQGLQIATYAWRQSEAPKAAIVMFHSYTSYALFDFLRHQPPSGSTSESSKEEKNWVPKYPGSWIEAFYQLGMNVYALDHQSHGCSEGWNHWRCNVDKFDHMVDDALQFLTETVTADPALPADIPIIILGYSMGGNIAIQSLGRIFSSEEYLSLKRRVRQGLLLAPMIKIKLDPKTEFLVRVNRVCISCWLPNLRFARSSTSVCPYLEWWYANDPFAYSGRIKSGMIAALYDASLKTGNIIKAFPSELKLLCFQGSHDLTVDFRAPLKLYETPVQLDLLYLCGWSHYLTKQHGAEKLIGIARTWITKHELWGCDSFQNVP